MTFKKILFPLFFFLTLLSSHPLWARGGGGCFLAETLISREDGPPVTIDQIQVGDRVLSFDDQEKRRPSEVVSITQHEVEAYYLLTTASAQVRVTGEHPFYVGKGMFKTIEALNEGDTIYSLNAEGLHPDLILKRELISEKVTVYNLETDPTHTYFANNYAVHNKGGGGSSGGGSGGFSSSSSSRGYSSSKSGNSKDNGFFVLFLIIFSLVFIYYKYSPARSNQDLDFLYPPKAIKKKSRKTRVLLEFIAKTDPDFSPDPLTEITRNTFLKLQTCWQARDYAPMQPLMMADLYAQHLFQINGMIRNHEINKIEGLEIKEINLVNVRYTHLKNQREFTALITAQAMDYYIDDRSRSRLRGDREPARFQEFWTFQWQDSGWRLREIEQTKESDALKDENFFEPFTSDKLQQLYAESAGASGPSGPWLEKETEKKANKIERLLQFLSQTDKLWNRQLMLERARAIFTKVHMARESANPETVPNEDLFPSVAQELKQDLQTDQQQGLSVEFRNFCIRKVELILVRNFSDNQNDEFTVRISAHAQKIRKKKGAILSEDPDVRPFTEYWTLGRFQNSWRLKEIRHPAQGTGLIHQENIDQDSSPDQLQWYYQKERS